jgi:metallo-beta-lactamase family protein
MNATSGASPTLSFLGAAGTVTGSKYLLRSAEGRQVLVDCGLFQGRKELRLRNWERLRSDPSGLDPTEIDPGQIDAVILTHAHIDHCGYLPRLVNDGFNGPVWCTPGTARLVRIMLPDSGHLQEEEAEFANRKGYSRHRPAEPLYTEEQAIAALAHLHTVEFAHPIEIVPGVVARMHHAGHILGAASLEIELTHSGTRVLFSGDLGRHNHPLLRAPDLLGPARDSGSFDVVICETTYGDEDHPSEAELSGESPGQAESSVQRRLGSIVNETCERGGVVLIPAFAVDRTEIVLHHLDALRANGEIPDIPIFVDSPMASAALNVYRSEAMLGSPEFRPEAHATELFPNLTLIETTSVEDSKRLNTMSGPMVIISASGMATGGRILHHLAARMGDRRNSIVLSGFQAPGTRGSRLAAGEKTIKLLGAYRQVAAQVHSLTLSAHADRSELTEWIRSAVVPADPEDLSRCVIYLTHGEPAASAAFAEHLALDPEISPRALIVTPVHGEVVRLDQ